MKILLLLVSFCSFLFSVTPKYTINASSNVTDLIFQDNKILFGTDSGKIEIFNYKNFKKLSDITFDGIKDFSNKLIGARIFSIDKIPNKDIILAVVQGEGFYTNLYIVENLNKSIIISKNEKLMIKKAKFIDDDHILIALMSNEIILFDFKNLEFKYRISIGESSFSDFALSASKELAAFTSESGKVKIIDIKSGKILQTLSGGNVDNIYDLDFKSSKVLTAGRDRRSILYDLKSKKFKRFDGSFLIYACALSPDENLAAIATNDKNYIEIYDLKSNTKIQTLIGQKSTLNTIVFVDNKNVISASDDKNIMIWSLR